MANEKISEYLTAYSATINDATLKFDVSHGILTKYLTGAELVTRLQSDISTIYTADSTLLGDRNVNLGAFNLGFTNGQVAFGTVSLGNEVVRILSAAGEDALQIDTDSSSNVIVVIDDGATGKVGFGHNSPTEGIHSTVNARFDAKILQNLTAAQSLSDIHFAKTSSNAMINQVTSAGAFPVFSAMRTRGTIAIPTALLSGDTVGQYVFTGHNGSTFTDVVQIKAVAKENYSTGNHGTELQFYTTPLTTGGPVQQMVLMENGNLAIGLAVATEKFHLNGSGRVDGRFHLNAAAAASTTSFGVTSIAGDNFGAQVAATNLTTNGIGFKVTSRAATNNTAISAVAETTGGGVEAQGVLGVSLLANATNNYGLRGQAKNGSTVSYGVYAQVTSGATVVSSSSTNAIVGVNQSSNGTVNRGVWAVSISTSGKSIGAEFSASGGATNYALLTNGGNIGFGTLVPSTSALLELKSTTQGFLLPRMTAVQASAITPVDGLTLYTTTTDATFTSVGVWAYEAATWIKL